MAVRSETYSHWPSDIQKQNLIDVRTDAALVTHQDKQDRIMSILEKKLNEVSDMKAGSETSQHSKKCTECPLDFRSG